MNIGKLKNLIFILGKAETETPNGFMEQSWSEEKKAWAEIKSMRRSRLTENDKETEETLITFTIRTQVISFENRVRYQEKDFDILLIEEEGNFLTIETKEVK